MDWKVRTANMNDEAQVLEAIRLFVEELSGKPDNKLPENAKNVFRRIVNSVIPGTVLVAETEDNEIIGCATVSIQEVIYKGGAYALLQELWVHPSYRSLSVGNSLISAVENYCRDSAIKRLEVCLPDKSFHTFDKTYNFYQRNRFFDNGPYMAKKVE
ncbi:GNAT family N-acetyltransferase [Sutcliffiella cohnii]|uniref:GNAT family N-acetyltransferase n=1 Tax=Sutcliffiella cohnii TaxID=33932 RepID=UPI002E23CE89|nr:GNAT family N-acetyltransferase [Sutcliffiella cohnii]